MGQVYLQSFLVLSGCPFRCPAVPHKQLWEHWKLTDRLCIHWGPVLAHLGLPVLLSSCQSTKGDFSSKWERWERLGWTLILKYWAELMFSSQKSCRDVLLSNSSLPVPCRAQRLTIAGCVRMIFLAEDFQKLGNLSSFFSDFAVVSDVTLNKAFYFCIFKFFSYGRWEEVFVSVHVHLSEEEMLLVFQTACVASGCNWGFHNCCHINSHSTFKTQLF